MKNFLKILILPVAVIAILGFAPRVFAVAPLEVTFDPDPLFEEENFLPLDETSGTATVTNNSGVEQNILTEAINILDDDNFSNLLRLKIEGGTPFDDSLVDFFAGGEVSLGIISNGESKTFTYTVSFINSNDNTYQGKTLGFDVCVGFEGGATHCGDTVAGGENDTDGGGGTGNPPSGGTIPGTGGGGGGSGQFVQLVVFGESVLNTTASTATIGWDTNLLATSQVIYGPVPPGGYILNTSILPNLGYPLGTAENPIKVLDHSVTLTGLVSGQTYVYRVVSRASPPTVSVEHTFTMPTTSTSNTEISRVALDTDTGTSEVAQEPFLLNTESTSTEETVVETGVDNSNLLAFALGGLNFDLPGLICVGVALLIFLVFLGLVWLIYQPARLNDFSRSGGNKKDKPLSREVAWFVAFGLIVSVILWFIPYTCPIIPLWVIIAIYVIWKLVSKRRSTSLN
ncbi:MAG: fibronectin type III domain-containing protein [bacterium]|nr:fibronectin type III domain-containing protein [bacterium]